MLALGTRAPDFSLVDVRAGDTISLDSFTDASGLLVMFICNHCPFVKHVQSEFPRLAADYTDRGIAVVAINANDSQAHTDDDPTHMKAEAATLGYNFPYLWDESQEVAKAYRAACTPDFFLFDNQRELVYRGQLDDSRPGNHIAVTGGDVRAACDALLAAAPPLDEQRWSVGCNIKWKPGNAPDYVLG